MTLSIAHVASEMSPLVKVGGLGDVIGALAFEQARRGHRVVVALPRYASLEVPAGWTRTELAGARVPWGMGGEPAHFTVLDAPGDGPRVLLVGHEGERRFFDRPGIYDDPRTGEGWPDSAERFLYFSRAALQGLARLGERYDVLHAHDHQAAWVPCFARTHDAGEPAFSALATVFTIHNLGYQGIHDAWVLGLAGFGRDQFHPASPFEFWGRVNYMKVGIAFADMISTVSPRYAREVQTSGEFGFGLEGLLARRCDALRGILNGIDDAVWDPARDPHLAVRYDLDTVERKAGNRSALLREAGLPEVPDWPIVGVVSRLVLQKGFDLVEQAAPELMQLDARFVVLGAGQPRFVELFRRLAQVHPERLHYRGGYDEPFAHLIEGGADVFLMPSHYEPCGLNQMYSLRYGTVPVVRAVGGLADTVREFDPLTREGNGFTFERFEALDMVQTLRRALAFHRQPELWRALQRNGMSHDFSWRASADGYDALYAEARERVGAGASPTLESLRGMIRP